jgi:hypothetical protein
MKQLTIALALLLALVTVPSLVLAHCGSAEHGGVMQVAANHQGHEGHDHSGHDHGGMAAAGSIVDLGDTTVNGVEAMAHMKDVRASMAKMGMKTTHHFMVMFEDEKSGDEIESGTVAVKITAPDGTVTGPVELMGMSGHFGADVTLDKPGAYTFQVGSKLPDGVVRQFEFKTTLK